jgi:tetratricopeptide (TPR) repeat protein
VGEGGMGSVYEAEQEQPRRIVALKVIRPGLAGPDLLWRFRQESQALARLQHPGIAQIYEAGAEDSGAGLQPFSAMEFIRGRPLLRYAEEHRLNTRQRLELMAKVCEAVHHAHQRGLIHRDLKPGNILVDEAGQPKILDFGVARVTDSDIEATQQTDVGQLVGTLAYMSPEQVLADPLALDTRSDVYALGVILYQLLAGRLPYHISPKVHEAVRAIQEDDPAPLSSINRSYRGDVETIVAKALEKDKVRRYASAADLAGDIRRYLQDEPIIARPAGAIYQLEKFARRHKALVTGVLAVFVVLVGGVIASTGQAMRARRAEGVALGQRDRAVQAEAAATRERNRALGAEAQAVQERNKSVAEKQRADSEAATAKAVSDFLENDLLAQASANNQSGPAAKPDPDLKVRTALDRAAARIGGKFDRQPEVEAAIRDTIGQTYSDLGQYPEARKHLERALDLSRRVLGADNPKTLNTMSRLGATVWLQGKYPEAESLQNETLAIQRRVLGPEHPDTLKSLIGLANSYSAQGKYAQAETLYSETLAIQRRVLGPEHPNTLASMNDLANSYDHQGKNAQAEALNSETLEIKRRVLGPEHPDTLKSMNNLATTYRSEGKYAEAEALLAQTLEIKRRALGPEHPNTLLSMTNLAVAYYLQGKYAQAEEIFNQTLEVKRRVLGPEHPDTLVSMNDLADAYYLQGKYVQAEEIFNQTLEISRRVLGSENPYTLTLLSDIAGMYQRQGKYGKAETVAAQSLVAQRHTLGPENPDTMDAAADLALAYQSQGKFAESEPLARQAFEFDRKKRPDDWQRFRAESLLGGSLAGQKKYAEAEPLLLQGYQGMAARKQRIAVPDRYHLDRAREWIVQLYEAWGKPEKAAEWRKAPTTP